MILRFIRQKRRPQLDIELRRIVGIRAEVIDAHRLGFLSKKHRKESWMRSQKNITEFYLHSALGVKIKSDSLKRSIFYLIDTEIESVQL